MPRIALLKKPNQTHFVSDGARMWEFHGGQAETVPSEVAEICLSKKDDRGNPLFALRDVPDPDVEAALGIQLEFNI
jgi:hypothetical protein